MKIAICPGSYDPVTKGHIDIINRAVRLFDKVIVLLLVNPLKTPVFSEEERLEFLNICLKDNENVEVMLFSGLLADFVEQSGACAIVKGLRAVTDFEYEFQMALANKQLNSAAETVFLPASGENMYLSSSLVRQIARFGGDVRDFIAPEIAERVLAKFKN